MKKKTLKCTMRLLKEGVPVTEALKDGHELSAHRWGTAEAICYAGVIYSGEPAWSKFVSNAISDAPELRSMGSAAILFVTIGTRTMVVTFGHAHLALNIDKCEYMFGLKTVLNSVERENIRSIDLATPDSVTFQRRIQASKDSNLDQFGFNIERDLLTVAAGSPTDVNFASFVAGKDALNIVCKCESTGLVAKCAEVLSVYESGVYEKDYKWIDNIKHVRDKEVLKKLDAELTESISLLRAGQDADLHLAPPEVVDYTDGGDVHYNGFGSGGSSFCTVDILDYVAELNRSGFSGGIDEIKKHSIATRREGETKFAERWKLYDGFVMETELDGFRYVLFSGKWFCVDKEFASEVEGEFTEMPKTSIIGATTAKNEQVLIGELKKSRTSDLLMLDRMKINPGGVTGVNLEPCDFFSIDRQFIHIKDGHSSGMISHLWNQGMVSAEAMLADKTFVKQLQQNVRKLSPKFAAVLPDGRTKVVAGDYEIVYAVMRKRTKKGELDLPFFSKVSLRQVVRRLTMLGFKVSIELVEKQVSQESMQRQYPAGKTFGRRKAKTSLKKSKVSRQ